MRTRIQQPLHFSPVYVRLVSMCVQQPLTTLNIFFPHTKVHKVTAVGTEHAYSPDNGVLHESSDLGNVTIKGQIVG